MPFDPARMRKRQGDLLVSADWNDLIDEAKRLGDAKVNKSGDTIGGPLTVTGALAVGAAAPAGVNAHISSADNVQLRLTQTRNNDWSRLSLVAGGNEYVLAVGAPGSSTPNEFNVYSSSANRNVATVNPDGLTVRGALTVAGSDIYFTETTHTHTARGNALGQAAIENAAGGFNTLMILGRTVSTDPVRRVVGLWDYLQVNGDLHVTSRITSPRFRLTKAIDVVGPLPRQGGFTSGGGILMIIVSGSGWTSDAARRIGMRVLIDGAVAGETRSFSNELNSHKVFSTDALVVDNIAAGNHTVRLEALPSTNTDLNDFFTATVLELPFNNLSFGPIVIDPINTGGVVIR